MPEQYTYILVDFFCLLFPFIASFHPRIQFYKQWKYFIIPCILTAFLFLVWDVIFVNWGVWGFNEKYILGHFVLNMPIEEILFFIFIPYACVFTYYCFDKFITFPRPGSIITIFNYLLTISLAITAFIYHDRLYTSVTFSLLALFLLFLMRSGFNKWFHFYSAYLFILIPFLISNGILTGSYIDEPVVIYNNAENLGIRIFTIPFEDAFYAMLMMAMNVYGFEKMRGKAKA
jgi:lycopene cyclase domain-containing protein